MSASSRNSARERGKGTCLRHGGALAPLLRSALLWHHKLWSRGGSVSPLRSIRITTHGRGQAPHGHGYQSSSKTETQDCGDTRTHDTFV